MSVYSVPKVKETLGKMNWAFNPSRKQEISAKFLTGQNQFKNTPWET